ncbi:MAG: thymidine phosphorylase [Candidatus Zixiibacteriota bacterium]
MYDIITKKRDKRRLSKEEIECFVSGYTKGTIPDYQASALLMAIFLNGMDAEETFNLTSSMMRSGKVVDLSSIPGIKVDKHSTGGVGDKVSLILAPLVAACGVSVPMISGRGLGHTGGTLDKLESVPGFKTDLSLKKFLRNLSDIGVCMIGQTGEIAPADKKIYDLRDVTGTVNCIPLITASILSKKLAEGASALVFDVKVGNGAFMRKEDEAIILAKNLILIAKRFKKKAVALITDMNEPLGEAVGNSIEVIEAIQALKDKPPEDLMKVTFALGAYMLILGGNAKNFKEAKEKLEEAIKSGKALDKFKQMVKKQGGNPRVVDNYRLLRWAKHKIAVESDQTGYVKSINTLKIGLLATKLGVGRERLGSKVDPGVGFLIKKKVGDRVKKDENLAVVFSNDPKKGKWAKQEIKEAYRISKRRTDKLKKILYLVDEKRTKKWNEY